MEVQFKDADLDILEQDANFNAGLSQSVVSAFRKRMQQIRAALDEQVFYSLRSLHFEKSNGGKSHQYSMRLNDQRCLIIEFDDSKSPKQIIIIGIEDYH